MKLLYQTTLLALLPFCVEISIMAQKQESFPTRKLEETANERPNHCWYNNMLLDQIKQHIPTDKTIIVIARLGDKDFKPDLNKRRLHNIRAYLTLGESYKHTEESIILAEGEPTKGFGHVEFYVDGRLIEVIKAHRNRDLAVTDCYAGIDGEVLCAEDWQKLFYPCKNDVRKVIPKQKAVPKKKKPRK